MFPNTPMTICNVKYVQLVLVTCARWMSQINRPITPKAATKIRNSCHIYTLTMEQIQTQDQTFWTQINSSQEEENYYLQTFSANVSKSPGITMTRRRISLSSWMKRIIVHKLMHWYAFMIDVPSTECQWRATLHQRQRQPISPLLFRR